MDEVERRPSVVREHFGSTPQGEGVERYTLSSPSRVFVAVLNYGGVIQSVEVPDRNGVLENVVLGFDSFEDYVNCSPYFGCIAGRYANRIRFGRFALDGVTYELAVNDPPNALHGGVAGFDKQLWDARSGADDDRAWVVLSYFSRDGEEGYPGGLHVSVAYSLGRDGSLTIDYRAEADRATVVNLTNHTYWNLAGGASSTVEDHVLALSAARFTPIDETMIPTGELADVVGTPFDFVEPRRVGERIDVASRQLAIAGGYDHNYVLDSDGDRLGHAASLWEPSSGRRLDVLTTEPGLQVYSGNRLDGTLGDHMGRRFVHRGGIALETQHFPDSPNRPRFPSTVLRPGEVRRSRTVYRFGSPFMRTFA
jgi:aldose 1-epimerase